MQAIRGMGGMDSGQKATQPYIEVHVSVVVSLLPLVIVFRLVFWAFSNVSAELMLLLVYIVI